MAGKHRKRNNRKSNAKKGPSRSFTKKRGLRTSTGKPVPKANRT